MEKLDVVRCLSVGGPRLIACRSAGSNLCADFLSDDGGIKLAILEMEFEKLVQRSVITKFCNSLKNSSKLQCNLLFF